MLMKKIYLKQSVIILFLLAATSAFAQLPQAGFSISSNQGCAPFSIQFTNTSTNAVSYQWNFGNGNQSTLVNPQNVYTAPGVYTVSLTATAANGQTHTTTQTNVITIYGNPTADFTVNTTQGCRFQTTFQFTSTSTGASTFFWDFGDGTFSSLPNPTKVYSTEGVYNVSLLVTNSTGCTNVKVMPNLITIHGLPNPQFTANQTVNCDLNFPFVFTPSVTSGLSYLWHFGDGTTSTQATPTKIYGQPGVFTVKLVVTNANGCKDSLIRNNYITIHTPVNPSILAPVTAACPPLNANFTTNVSDAVSYQWDLGNSQTSTLPSASTTYQNTGSYSVSLTVTMSNGCSYTSNQNDYITVHPVPVPNFTLENTSGCAPHTITVNNLCTGATSFQWDFENFGSSTSSAPTIQYTYQNPGSYNVRVTVSNQFGCVRSLNMPNAVTVNGPVAQFTATPTSGCPPLAVSFTNTSTGSTASSYLWDFGNGQTSTQQNPTQVYTQNGAYTVTLTVTSAGGCSSTKVMNNFVNVSYNVANYTPPASISGCSPFSSSFSITNQQATSYLWDFGDGSTSTEQNPSHTFTQGGTYNVSLLMGQSSGCSIFYPVFQTVIVDPQLPAFTVNVDPCPPHAVHFTDNSTNAVSWLWNFGDGTTSTLQNPTHTYSDMSSQNVTLTITTASGCTYSYIGYNAVNFTTIQANWSSTYTTGPFPQTVQFTSLNPDATSWSWDFGDGTTSTEQNPIHTYLTDSAYTVTLTITVANCSVSTEGSPFTMSPAFDTPGQLEQGGPGTYFPPENVPPIVGCSPLSVTFYKQSPLHQVIQWNFGNGVTSALQNPQYTYQQPGYYEVSYTAQTPIGVQTINYPQAIYVGGPQAAFTVNEDQQCTQSTFQLSAQTHPSISTYAWAFSNNTTASVSNPTVTLPSSNSAYTVTLTVTDTLGCMSSASQSLYTQPTIPGIVYPTQVCKTAINFTHSIPTNYQFLWNFGDGNSSTLAQPSHQYQQAGVYTPSVAITAPNGCVTQQNLNPITFYNPVANFVINGPLERCAPANFVATPTGSSGGSWPGFNSNGYVWEIPPVYNSYSDSLVYNMTSAGSRTFRLRVVNTAMANCSSVTDYVTVVAHEAQANFTFTQSGLCLPITAQFTDQSVQPVSWLWNFGNGQTSTQQNPSHTFATMPPDSVSLTITDVRGCSKTRTRPNIQDFTATFLASVTNGCNPLTTTFSCTAPGATSYFWDFGDGSTSTSATPTHTYTTNGTHTVKLIATSVEGCSDTLIMPGYINVMGPVAAFMSPTPAGCAPSIVEFIDQSQGAVSWFWDFGDNTYSYIQHPSKIYAWPGQYTVSLTITAANGCTTLITYPNYVTVLGPGTTFTASASSVCENNQIQFTESSTGAVSWEWNFGDGSISTQQQPTHHYAVSGTYTVTLFTQDTLGCTAFFMIQTPISVHGYPTAAFSIDQLSGCTPLNVQLSNTSTGNNTYLWNFGNGGTSTLESPSALFTTAGNYTISMIATNEFGCTDTAPSVEVWAKLVPEADFQVSQTEGCTPLSVLYNNTSTSLENASYNWSLGNGSISSAEHPQAIYLNPGMYQVSLIVQNANGCADTISKPDLIQVFDTIAPPLSELVRVTVVNETTVNIFWMQNTASDFSKYELYRHNSQTNQFDLIQTFNDIHLTSYSDIGLNTLANSYCYKVMTYDRCGYVRPLDEASEHCTIDISAQTQTNNTIQVYWSPYVGKQVTNYVILRTEENTTNTETVATVPGHITSIVDSTVICPVKYKYSVTAKSLNGQLHLDSDSDYDFSDPIQNLFTEQKVDAARSTVVQNKFVYTEWATPSVMGQHVTAYRVLRSTDNYNFNEIAIVPAHQTSFIDESADVNTTKYYYQIMSINVCSIDGKEGAKSDNIVLKANANESWGVNLDWTPYLGWTTGVAFYIVEKLDDNGQWQVIKQVNGSTTSTVDEN